MHHHIIRTIPAAHAICCICMILAHTLSGGTICFHAWNSITWESVIPDSIHIINVTRGVDTMLVGETAFDTDVWTDVMRPRTPAPDAFHLIPSYPNPFSGQTKTTVILPENDVVTVRLYNIRGRQVAACASRLPAGVHTFRLEGSGLARGLYLLRASASRGGQIIKILKTGAMISANVAMGYEGPAAAVGSMHINKGLRSPDDICRFTVYANGFYPKTLDNQVLSGDTSYRFDLIPVPPPDDFTSKWFGFNLLGKFTLEWSNEGYSAKDFEMISGLGFHFVRLPIDYRTFTEPGDWTSYDAGELAEIDSAVAWGRRFGIHVSINLHRAPGYCVNPPGTPLPPDQDVSLWDNPQAQDAFAAIWRMFAERYQDVPTGSISFNLVNEPPDIGAGVYVDAVLPAVEAIRDVSPDRIIISDGVDWGNTGVDAILDYGVVMSPHFYNPFRLTHYMASWVGGSDTWPEPVWPPSLVSCYFYGSVKSPLNTPMEIEGNFPAGTEIILHVHQVSSSADFRAAADGRTVFTHQFSPGPGEGEWQEVIYAEEWHIYQNIYNRDYSFVLDQEVRALSLRIHAGDWMTFNRLRIIPPAGSGSVAVDIQPGITDWGVPQAGYTLDEDGILIVSRVPAGFEDDFKMNGFLDPWIELRKSGTPVHVGEWGVYNKTPHDVTLRFMENRLQAMQSAGLGWALWNFRGSFGVLDSGRSDVLYENWQGHQLDRRMLNLLQKYID